MITYNLEKQSIIKIIESEEWSGFTAAICILHLFKKLSQNITFFHEYLYFKYWIIRRNSKHFYQLLQKLHTFQTVYRYFHWQKNFEQIKLRKTNNHTWHWKIFTCCLAVPPLHLTSFESVEFVDHWWSASKYNSSKTTKFTALVFLFVI